HGSRYVGKIYNDQWMVERGFLEVKSFRDIVSARAGKKLVTINTSQTVAEAVALMKKFEIEHIPVIKEQDIAGSISEAGLFLKVFNNP
ncbi:CBS domain-containing protein, partial [Vibrio parahaemolyticus]